MNKDINEMVKLYQKSGLAALSPDLATMVGDLTKRPKRSASAVTETPQVPCLSALSATTVKKNTNPMADIFGPFPDETVASCVDRVLHILGVDPLKKYRCSTEAAPDSNSSNGQGSNAACSVNERYRSISDVLRDKGDSSSPSRSMSPGRKCCCPKCTRKRAKALTPTSSSIADFIPPSLMSSMTPERIDEILKSGAGPAIIDALKGTSSGRSTKPSSSICSLASHKPRHISFKGKDCVDATWCLSRVTMREGCEIFEVFRNMTSTENLQTAAMPDLMYVSLPDGNVVPFETVKIPHIF